MEDNDLAILLNPYHSGWYLGDTRRRAIRSHGIGLKWHVPWCMLGSLTSGRWRGKRSRHARRKCNQVAWVVLCDTNIMVHLLNNVPGDWGLATRCFFYVTGCWFLPDAISIICCLLYLLVLRTWVPNLPIQLCDVNTHPCLNLTNPPSTYRNLTLRNKLRWNCNQNTSLIIHGNAYQNMVCKKATNVVQGKMGWKSHHSSTFHLRLGDA